MTAQLKTLSREDAVSESGKNTKRIVFEVRRSVGGTNSNVSFLINLKNLNIHFFLETGFCDVLQASLEFSM